MPSEIDRGNYKVSAEKLSAEDIGYAKIYLYHNMFRYFSRSFYHHPLLQNYKYTWRLEPGVGIYCDINYDVFQFMEVNDKLYGYTINIFDTAPSVRSLWQDIMEFWETRPRYINPNDAFKWFKEMGQKPETMKVVKVIPPFIFGQILKSPA